jgi:hypothetical protein
MFVCVCERVCLQLLHEVMGADRAIYFRWLQERVDRACALNQQRSQRKALQHHVSVLIPLSETSVLLVLVLASSLPRAVPCGFLTMACVPIS